MNANTRANHLKAELDNFVVSTNNSGAYKKLQKEYIEYTNLKV
jgi:hypothetical protein